MAISDNINDKAAKIHDEFLDFQAKKIAATPIATEVRTKSTEAIHQGSQSQAWVKYMKLFAKSEQELDRLIPGKEENPDPELQKVRAYLVANGMCSMGTTSQLINNVGARLDLPNAPTDDSSEA